MADDVQSFLLTVAVIAVGIGLGFTVGIPLMTRMGVSLQG